MSTETIGRLIDAVKLLGLVGLAVLAYWLGALLVALIAGGVAVWLAQRGRRALSPSALAPHETVATLKEDKEWLKQRLTSGATSS